MRKGSKLRRDRRPCPENIPAWDSIFFPTGQTVEDYMKEREGKQIITSDSVFDYIADNQGVNTPGLAIFFTKTTRTISRFTTELRYRDLIEYRGSLAKGGYFLTEKGRKYLENPESIQLATARRMTAQSVFEFIKEHGGANHFDIAANFCRTIKSVARHTQRLRQENKIEFRGTPRDGGFWEI